MVDIDYYFRLNKTLTYKLLFGGVILYGINDKVKYLGNIFLNRATTTRNTDNTNQSSKKLNIYNKKTNEYISTALYVISLVMLSFGVISYIANIGYEGYNYYKNYNKQTEVEVKPTESGAVKPQDDDQNKDNDVGGNEDASQTKIKYEYVEKRWYYKLYDILIWLLDFIITLFFIRYLSMNGLHILSNTDSNSYSNTNSNTNNATTSKGYPSMFRYIFEYFNAILAIPSTLIYEIFGYKKSEELFKKGDAPGIKLLDVIRVIASIPLDTKIHDSIRRQANIELGKTSKENPYICDDEWIKYTFYLLAGGFYMYTSPVWNIITIMLLGSFIYYGFNGDIRLPFLKKQKISDVFNVNNTWMV